MRIKRFISIKNVGRLVNCKQRGTELKRYNLFFAENGRGKTTLCAVLRSLQTDEYKHITERTTLESPLLNPEVEIRLDTENTSYKAQNWSKPISEIVIFDATFVAKNVYSGEYVSRDHRTNMLRVIIGEDGLHLADRVDQLDQDIRNKNLDIKQIKNTIQSHLPNGVKLESFLALKEVPDIDDKIAEKKAEFRAAKQDEQIKTRPLLEQLAAPSLSTDFELILSKTLSDVSEDVERKLKMQIKSHEMHDRGQAWISEGLGYIRNDACPFCGQGIEELDLIEAYKQFFSEAYAELVKNIHQLEKEVETTFGNTALANLHTIFTKNKDNIQFWKQFAIFEINEIDFENMVAVHAKTLCDAALALIKRKLENPLAKVLADNTFRMAKMEYDKTTDILKAYGDKITAANAVIAKQKEKTELANSLIIKTEIADLELIQLRQGPKVKPLCAKYQSLKENKKKLDSDKRNAKNKLDKHVDKTISDYEKAINKFLAAFGAGFSITKSKKNYFGGTPASDYQILINRHPVALGDNKTPLGQPCFRTTLSAGDKSSLALAFFLAQLDQNPKKADSIIVFDDPFNSQDRSRRERTAELLKKYGRECAQLLLFSHDPYFLHLVHSKIPKDERHSLQLSRAHNNTTTIEGWDIEKETQESYFKDHADLSSYLENGTKDLTDIAKKIRLVLEGYLRRRFPNQFPDNAWLGDMINDIRTEGKEHPIYPTLEKLESINNFSKKYHHAENSKQGSNDLVNDDELQKYVEDTLEVVGGY